MATGAPGNSFSRWSPTPPERGSFPLDHDGECKQQMMDYLKCMKFTENLNAPNCRVLAKNYLKCRMDNQLMDKSEWDSLGLVNLPNDTTDSPKNQNGANPRISSSQDLKGGKSETNRLAGGDVRKSKD
ncbi:uncharacterized protein AC631_03250 [Debaryomyces fabryi]|uniref:Cytochrome c oxidase assembly protein COX19 n=1 Tax=Debaryomyces fabryi TaxID=58627 RepID=A0A0V1PXM4_9ASCO|nr:uncharacterized protein AC631_03250 [Debaryomyces fabryi]KSA00999.1 hypothetical protein AC631_03250 [Debaryomyces fabryi]